jgi:N6-adenosine-specific RNA methylase IME4
VDLDAMLGERVENVDRLDFAPSEAVAIGRDLEPMERAAAKERQGYEAISCVDSPQLNPGKSLDHVAEMVGMARTTYQEASAVVEAAENDVENYGDLVVMMDANRKVHPAYKELRKRLREDDIAQQREAIAKIAPESVTEFDVIVIDPPWPYGTKYDPAGRRAANPYPEMSLEEIAKIQPPAKADCVLWLWTTHKFMRHSFVLLDGWGFRDVAILTWVKDRMGLGSWLRSQSEFCIMAIKGKPTISLSNQTTIITGPLREHSRKPDEFYAMVDSLCVGAKCDYFSREAREGWSQYGNDQNRFSVG